MPYRRIKGRWEGFLSMLPGWLSPWVRDAVDVGVTVGVIIIVLKLLLGADMLVPLVVVTSQSMSHQDQSWILWMENRGIQRDEIDEFPLKNGFNMGDMIVVKAPNGRLGDVIIFERDLHHLHFDNSDPIIHRIVGVGHVRDYEVVSSQGTLDCHDEQSLGSFANIIRECQRGYQDCPYTRYPGGGDFMLYITKGDNNAGSDQCNPRLEIAYPVNSAQLTGNGFLRLPMLGWPKIILSLIFRILTFQI